MTIENSCRTELKGITAAQREGLVAKLQTSGYHVDEFGNVKPKELPQDYPYISVDGDGWTTSARVPLTLGYVGSTFALLNNIDQPDLHPYHAHLRRLYAQA
ncbi:hypothetical protein HYU22_01785 [Candidatus Woesearchaeota archaeon]|nr:hypothetical protein [Candidatus Woesearchaeota archaeon]